LRLIREAEQVSADYFKKLVNTNDIWEVRVHQEKLSIRILGFFHKNEFIILTNGFIKKSQKTPADEIHLAEERRKDFLSRK
jgi:phage-related protein